jgi:aminoglycoside 6'-N-acetyltransferase
MLVLRPAVLADIATLEAWDREPHVIAATTDSPQATQAFGDHDWHSELAMQSQVYRYLIAELDGRPIGAMLIIDPHREPTHYWGLVEPDLRAIDVWIGSAADLGRGHGAQMMRLAIDACFADPDVTAIVIDPLASNPRAHRFYQRLGFEPTGRHTFGEDDCLVHRLSRAVWRARASTER